MPTGQLWLCFPREENCTKIDPRRVQKRPVGGPKWSPGHLRTALLCQFAARAVRKPCLGGSGGALGALLAARGAVLKPLGPLLGRPGPLLGALGGGFGTSQGLIWTIWTMSVALREIQQKLCILRCFWASRASRRGPKSLQNRPKRPLGRLVGPKIGLEGPSGGRQGPS